MAEAKPTRIDKLKDLHKQWKAGVAALAKAKLITAEQKTKELAKFDDKFKDLIKKEQDALKAKAKKKK